MRFNDGVVDSKGRFWAGAMNDDKVTGQEPTDEGALFRLKSDLTLDRILEKVTTPNGMGWSNDNKIMYFVDSPTKNIFAFDYDDATGELDVSSRRVFFHLMDEEGVPDGLTIDVEGCIWVAICFGSKVLKITPDGKVGGEISLPCRMITCPAFAGADLYITSGAEPEPSKYPQSAQVGGSLFRVHVGVQGRPLHKFSRR